MADVPSITRADETPPLLKIEELLRAEAFPRATEHLDVRETEDFQRVPSTRASRTASFAWHTAGRNSCTKAANDITMAHRRPRRIDTTCLRPSCYADPLNATNRRRFYNER